MAGAIAAAALITYAWTAADPGRHQLTIVVAVVVAILMAPVHIARSARWTTIAEFSTRAMSDLQELTAALPDGSEIALCDVESTRANRANLAYAFGALLNDGFYFVTGRRMSFRIVPPPQRSPNGPAALPAW